MTDINVFISSSWTDSRVRKSLMRKLKDINYTPHWDKEFGGYNQEAVRIMDESDVVVVHLCAESINSRGVQEELIRAHHQYAFIYAIVESSVLTSLPWFLDSDPDLRYDSGLGLGNAIDQLIRKIGDDRDTILSRKTHLEIRSQHQYFHEISTKRNPLSPEVMSQSELAYAIVRDTNNELESITRDSYKVKIGKSHHFLVRAKPVFENATQVYAVSIDSVSMFWVSPYTPHQKLSRDFLQIQPNNTVRLFVFQDPNSAHNYATILNSHARKYGARGRVFLCSLCSYKELMIECEDESKWLENDFAVLDYSASKSYLAKLDSTSFEVERIRESQLANTVKGIFSELNELQPGQTNERYNIMRWEVDLQKEKIQWVEKLRSLFTEKERDVLHLVFFTEKALSGGNSKADLRKKIQDVKHLIDEFKEGGIGHIKCKDVWLGESHVTAANDFKTNGRIINHESKQFPYLLFMRFADVLSLEAWYRHDKHSDARRRLFESFNPEIAHLFERIDAIAAENPDDTQVSTIYGEIEGCVSEYMGRRDYREDETLMDMVNKRPFRPRISLLS
jgi:hypothetical protein